MKYFRSLLFTVCSLLALAACNTDELKDDINQLKDRVQSLEAQVALLNDNMTAIKILLEGGKTITEFTNTNGTYTLKLSNGETITLTQGSKGEVKYPDITVNKEGQWVVNGNVLMQNGKPVQAVGTSGADGSTPKFRIDSEGNYWQVSYDNGINWSYVLNTNNEKVSAVGSGGGSATDNFFEDVKVEGNFFMVKLKGSAEYIAIPIAKDVVCQIIVPAGSMKNGFWEIGYEQTVTTTVKVKGDNVIATAPAGWVVTVSEPNAETNEATLTITAPAKAAVQVATRATANNSYDVTVQANTGSSWAVDKVQVKAVDQIGSYYAHYMAGETILINGIAVNKEAFGETPTLIEADQEIKTSGVYFIKKGVTANYTGTGGLDELILIGDDSQTMSTVNVDKQIVFNPTAGTTEGHFICKNIVLTGTATLNNQLLTVNTNATLKHAAFDQCVIAPAPGRHILYLSTSTRSIENFSMENCLFKSEAATQKYIISTATSTSEGYKNLTFKNNVFYCPTGKVAIFSLFNGTSAGVTNCVVENNTFVNMEIAQNATNFGLVAVKNLADVSVKNNLFWTNTAGTSGANYSIFNVTASTPTGTLCKDNLVYKTMTHTWQMFKNGTLPFAGAEELTPASSNPFEDGTFDLDNGKFIPNATYATYGASIY